MAEYTIAINDWSGNIPCGNKTIVYSDTATASDQPILVVEPKGLRLFGPGKLFEDKSMVWAVSHLDAGIYNSADILAGFMNANNFRSEMENGISYPCGDYISIYYDYSDKGADISLVPMRWAGMYFKQAMKFEFPASLSSINPPSQYMLDADMPIIVMPLHFKSGGKEFGSITSKYTPEDEIWTLYFGSERVLEYSLGDEEYYYINDAYRSMTMLHQPENYYLVPPIDMFIRENMIDTTRWLSLRILASDGSILANLPRFSSLDLTDRLLVTETGLTTDSGEVLYMYPGTEGFTGFEWRSHDEAADPNVTYAVGDSIPASMCLGGVDLYLMEEGTPIDTSHYMIAAETLKEIADAIRAKTDKDDPIDVRDFASEIDSILAVDTDRIISVMSDAIIGRTSVDFADDGEGNVTISVEIGDVILSDDGEGNVAMEVI